MRFRSSSANARLVVSPGDTVMEGGLRRPIRGLRAEFKEHAFDSKQAQKEFGWTDEERKRVEKAILTHKNFAPLNPKLGEARYYLEDQPQAHQGVADVVLNKLHCVYTVIGDSGNSELCGKEAAEGSDFCEDHAKLLDRAKAAVAEGV